MILLKKGVRDSVIEECQYSCDVRNLCLNISIQKVCPGTNRAEQTLLPLLGIHTNSFMSINTYQLLNQYHFCVYRCGGSNYFNLPYVVSCKEHILLFMIVLYSLLIVKI